MSLLQNSNAIETGGYPISNSLRFQSASSQYANRTPSSSSNAQKQTYSMWVKRGRLGSPLSALIGFSNGSTTGWAIQFTATDSIEIYDFQTSYTFRKITTAVYRDPSAWYHIVVALDTTLATASDRIKLWVNGTQVTAFSTSTDPSLNLNTIWMSNTIQNRIGTDALSNYFDGYMTEINFIDGQALTPSSFGETNTLTGQWVAKKYTGTYGTNGFYLPFSNGTSTTTLGTDSSGNGNNWTLTNFTRAAGVTDCWMYDVPSGNGSSVGGTQPNSNYAVLNPLDATSSTITAGNLNVATASVSTMARASIGMTSGKWYCEVIGCNNAIGISTQQQLTSNYLGQTVYSFGYILNGNKITNATQTAYGVTWSTTDVMGIAFDADNGTLTFYKNNVSQGVAFTGLTSGPYFFVGYGTATASHNFGQRSFAYTPPSGFKALCTANLPAPTIAKGNQYMDATLYTGNSASRSITNAAGFSPDMVWVKARSAATDNYIWDTVRGANGLVTNSTAAEFAGAQVVPTSNGFDLAASTGVNNSGTTYVGWQWDAGSSTVTNTSGTISSQVRANPTAGFSVVAFSNNATTGATVGHGLGIAPSMFIIKQRNAVGNWVVYHKSVGSTGALLLNSTAATATNSGYFNNTSPTSSVFTLGSFYSGASTDNYVAYCFAEIAGFSKFGSFTTNGSTDNAFIYLGFRPKYFLMKRTNAADSWTVIDTSRSPYNVAGAVLYPDLSNAEATNNNWDLLSNGVKIRAAYTNGDTYIYAAFAENPFAQANAR